MVIENPARSLCDVTAGVDALRQRMERLRAAIHTERCNHRALLEDLQQVSHTIKTIPDRVHRIEDERGHSATQCDEEERRLEGLIRMKQRQLDEMRSARRRKEVSSPKDWAVLLRRLDTECSLIEVQLEILRREDTDHARGQLLTTTHELEAILMQCPESAHPQVGIAIDLLKRAQQYLS